jgi:alanine-synthesizing transaminase
MFSNRLDWEQPPNAFSRLLQEKRARGEALIDLTESNPTRVGLEYPAEIILAPPDPSQALLYAPDPRGLAPTRRAIARHYGHQGARLDPQALFLTAGTSEAYSLVFKLLANPGDEILVPTPGYPLLSYLAAFEGLSACGYPLRCDAAGEWSIDLEALQARVTPRTRAIILVNPNNPTGSYVQTEELSAIDRLCRRRGLALIADEVFCDYAAQSAPADPTRSVLNRTRALTFVLNGFSKMLALPQFKLSWIVVGGQPELADAAQARLEILLDFYLSVGTGVQLAADRLMGIRETMQQQIGQRLEANSRFLHEQIARTANCRLLQRQGGWYAVVEIRDRMTDEARILQLADQENTLVHPGYFYDFDQEGFVVVSLLPESATFRTGVERLIGRFGI